MYFVHASTQNTESRSFLFTKQTHNALTIILLSRFRALQQVIFYCVFFSSWEEMQERMGKGK